MPRRLAALALTLPLAACAAPPLWEVMPLAAGARLAGVAQHEWSQRWWQWAYSFERARSPVADRTGERCASRQDGPVWFLAGAYGSQRVERTCRVPLGKSLFFPLVNFIFYSREGPTQDCAELRRKVIEMADDPDVLVLSIDGRRVDGLQAHRQTTPGCFSLVAGMPPDAAGSGYYVALPPLPKGEHRLEFGGVVSGLTQAISYTLIVE